MSFRLVLYKDHLNLFLWVIWHNAVNLKPVSSINKTNSSLQKDQKTSAIGHPHPDNLGRSWKMWTSMIRNNYFLPISFNPTIPGKHTGVFFWISKTQTCILWFICGSLPGKCFKSTWLSMWQVGGIFRNPVEKKNPITSVKGQVCESVYSTERRKSTTQPSPLLYLILRVQFHSYTLSVRPNVTNLV